MSTPSEPEPAPQQAPASGTRPRRGLRGLDRRTVAICVCVALLAALAAGLAASLVTDDGTPGTDDRANAMEVVPEDEVDRDDLLGVQLLTIDGEPTTLARQLGPKPLVVNLWAQSCVPCIDEMPMLEEVSRSDDRVAFLGVNVLDRLDKARAMAKQTGITYPWLRDPEGEFGLAAEAPGLPDTLLVAPDGTVLATKLGPFDDEADLRGWLDEHLP